MELVLQLEALINLREKLRSYYFQMLGVGVPQCAFADTRALHLRGSRVVEKLKNKTDQPTKLNKKSQQN